MTDTGTGQWDPLDATYRALLERAPAERRWLLVQTLATGPSRRALLGSLPIRPGARVLDIGCGFGAAALELATLRPVTVLGIDMDLPVLAVAARAVAALTGGPDPTSSRGLAPGSVVSFAAGDAYRLPVPDRSVDVALSRFVFQHLARPAEAATELHRVLRPGAMACVVDVDDGLSISEPEPSAAYQRLAGALRAAQAGAGGDRRVGRRLPALLEAAGFETGPVLVLPQAAYHRPQPGGPERALLIERLRAAKAAVVEGNHLSAEQFEAELETLAGEEPGPTLEVEAHLAVIATRR